MLKIENTEVMGWEHAIRGMRNPKNSWGKSDSHWDYADRGSEYLTVDHFGDADFNIGPNDQKLMTNLCNTGTDHRKFMRMIVVYVDITAPLYWWKEFDTYKIGTVANSCSTMHKIHAKEFDVNDFSHEHVEELTGDDYNMSYDFLLRTVDILNYYRKKFLETGDKVYWWQLIQLLPSSYNQKRTVMLNYEVLANIYKSRRNHKLDEWHTFCDWIKMLPYSELITGENKEVKDDRGGAD